MARAIRSRGFTLVEILIVVIILGVLAAIVMPKFSNASHDTKKSSVASSLHALRGQIELFMLQHGDQPPALTNADWSPLSIETTFNGQTCGPYLTVTPINPLNGLSDVQVVTTDVASGDAIAATGKGFVYNSNNGKLWATNTKQDRVYNEVDPSDPNN